MKKVCSPASVDWPKYDLSSFQLDSVDILCLLGWLRQTVSHHEPSLLWFLFLYHYIFDICFQRLSTLFWQTLIHLDKTGNICVMWFPQLLACFQYWKWERFVGDRSRNLPNPWNPSDRRQLGDQLPANSLTFQSYWNAGWYSRAGTVTSFVFNGLLLRRNCSDVGTCRSQSSAGQSNFEEIPSFKAFLDDKKYHKGFTVFVARCTVI